MPAQAPAASVIREAKLSIQEGALSHRMFQAQEQ
jgi:hypothetical protein